MISYADRVSASLPALVWNKGIAALCDHRVPDEFPRGAYSRSPRLARGVIEPGDVPLSVARGEVVWVRLSWLASFVARALPHIHADFILATGDGDHSVPSGIAAVAPAILEHPRVLHWFTQNRCAADARISPLPIGIDFHTVNDRPFWGEPVTSPIDQEQAMLAIARSLPPVERRVPRMYLDFITTSAYGDRVAILASLSRNPLAVVQPGRLPRNDLFRRRGEFAFVVSPHGNGLDCHRTWEALALGHIVLVPSSPLDPLYEGLAVVSVRDWTRITEDDLQEWLDRYGPMTRDNPRLTSRWWVARMRSRAEVARGPGSAPEGWRRSRSR